MQKDETLMINIGSTSVGGRVIWVKKGVFDRAHLELLNPVCTNIGDKVAISRRIDKHWRLIGFGEILKGTKM